MKNEKEGSSSSSSKRRMTTYRLYLGLNDKDTKRQKYDILEAYKVANNIVLSQCGGATIYSGQGIYKHYDGAVVIEQTLIIEICDIESGVVGEIVKLLKVAFNQESVLVDKIESEKEFV